jgi:hypothetical protein
MLFQDQKTGLRNKTTNNKEDEMTTYYNGITIEQVDEVEPGDVIWLAKEEVFLVVLEKGSPLRQGYGRGTVVQRSAVVKIGYGSQGLPQLHRYDQLMLMVTNDTPNRINIASF